MPSLLIKSWKMTEIYNFPMIVLATSVGLSLFGGFCGGSFCLLFLARIKSLFLFLICNTIDLAQFNFYMTFSYFLQALNH